jgi:hypothetical protein
MGIKNAEFHVDFKCVQQVLQAGPVQLADGRGGWGGQGAESYYCEKTWSALNGDASNLCLSMWPCLN